VEPNHALEAEIHKSPQTALSARHVPDSIPILPEVPRSLEGKKLEVEVKRILARYPPEKAVNTNSMANPGYIGYFVDFCVKMN